MFENNFKHFKGEILLCAVTAKLVLFLDGQRFCSFLMYIITVWLSQQIWDQN
jgi:hypothetical protein